MGLDMYLEKCNRKMWGYKDVDISEIKETKPQLYAEIKPFIILKGSSDIFQWESLFEEVGYWRKANAIHKWFVDNVQNGIDDCCYYEVTKENIQELLRRCKIIKRTSTMEKAYIENGKTFANDRWCPIYIEGETITNPNIAKNLLPTQEGFFFGGTNYDQWYMDDITKTIDILQKVLDETDFDREMIVYRSSW
jgi:hypothetical protein